MEELQRAGVVVLGVSADSPASHAKFSGKYRLPFPLLSDPDRKVMNAWGAYGDKVLYGKKTKGVIRSTVWIGPDGTSASTGRGWPTPPNTRPRSSRPSAAGGRTKTDVHH